VPVKPRRHEARPARARFRAAGRAVPQLEGVAEMSKIEAAKTKASFIEPMLLLRSERLPEGPE